MMGMGLLRFGLKMTFFVVTARWMYAEAALVAPNMLPAIDLALTKVAIPTHDTWGEHFASAKQFAQNFKAQNGDLFSEVLNKTASTKSGNSVKSDSSASIRNVMGSVSSSLRSATLKLEHGKS